jgi:hypothetical protein
MIGHEEILYLYLETTKHTKEPKLIEQLLTSKSIKS